MTKSSKEIPDFNSEEEEREFWATHDSTEYIDWDNAEKAVFPKLKPSTKPISVRCRPTIMPMFSEPIFTQIAPEN